MQIRIGLETAFEGRALGQALDHPAAFAYGEDAAEVLLRLPHALLEYDLWVRNHTESPWEQFGNLDFRLVEVFNTFQNGDYEVNAFFEDDRRPLIHDEIAQALLVHRWQREELLAGIETLPPELLHQRFPDQRWDIMGILAHIAGVEYWYLTRLERPLPAFSYDTDPLTQLEQSFNLVQAALSQMVGAEKIYESHGEFWSARKLVRRLHWHQRDHIGHIQELAGLKGK